MQHENILQPMAVLLKLQIICCVLVDEADHADDINEAEARQLWNEHRK